MKIHFGKLQLLEGCWIDFHSGSWLFACGRRCVRIVDSLGTAAMGDQLFNSGGVCGLQQLNDLQMYFIYVCVGQDHRFNTLMHVPAKTM